MRKYDERGICDSIWDLWCEIRGLYPRHEGFEKGRLFVVGGGDLVIHCVTQGHELIDLGHDTVLLGQGRAMADF